MCLVRHESLNHCDIPRPGNFPPLAVLPTPCFCAGGWPCSVWLRVEEKSPPYEAYEPLLCIVITSDAREILALRAFGWPLRPVGHNKPEARPRAGRFDGATHARSEMRNSLIWGFWRHLANQRVKKRQRSANWVEKESAHQPIRSSEQSFTSLGPPYCSFWEISCSVGWRRLCAVCHFLQRAVASPD
jgi:hypothetical protein